MWQYEYNNELYHYGVKGMKWGVRRARMQEARSAYKNAKNSAFSKYEKDIHGIEKGYKRGQMLSKKDQAREAAVEKRYSSDVARAKSNYKQAKQQIRTDAKQMKKDAKAERKEFKQDVKNATKIARKNPYSTIYDEKTGVKLGVQNNVIANASKLKAEKGQEYAERVLKSSRNKMYVTAIANTAAFAAGLAYLSRK